MKLKCDSCEKLRRRRGMIVYKGKFYCGVCKAKFRTNVSPVHNPHISLEEALNKIYEIKGYLNKKNGCLSSHQSFPSILIGHKVKLVLVK